MKRGLKSDGGVLYDTTQAVKEDSPMKRGLKFASRHISEMWRGR